MKKLPIVIWGMVAGLTAVSAARADIAVLGAAKDNTLIQTAGKDELSNGAGQHFFTGRTFQSDTERLRRGVIAFDVAGSVPSGAIITGVTLTLHMSKTLVGDSPVGLHRLAADWGEGASDALDQEGTGAIAQAGDATWVSRFFGTANTWTTPGGDFNPIASGSQLIGDVGFYTWSSTAGMIADVQTWLDLPAGNFGWLLQGDESGVSAKRFDTRENPTPEFRPVLTIEYVPEPATLALLALGGLTILRRRR